MFKLIYRDNLMYIFLLEFTKLLRSIFAHLYLEVYMLYHNNSKKFSHIQNINKNFIYNTAISVDNIYIRHNLYNL